MLKGNEIIIQKSKCVAAMVIATTSFLVACAPSLEGNDVNKAKSLAMSNMLCEALVNYRVGQVLLSARDGAHHKNLAEIIGEAVGLDISDTRKKLDVALGEDLSELFNSRSKDEYEVVVMNMFSEIQEGNMQKYGYSYPDCDMVISMSEAFIDQNSL